jgi:predicted transcriptional regulator
MFGSSLIVSVLAQGQQNQSGGYQGSVGGQSGPVNFPLSNNMQVNMSSSQKIDLSIEVDPTLENRFVGFNVNTSTPLAANLQIRENFPTPPQNRIHRYSKQGESPGPGPGPHMAGANTQGDEDESVEISYSYETYFILTLNATVESLEIYTLIDSALGVAEDRTESWVIYDNASDSWMLLDSFKSAGNLSTLLSIEEYDKTQYILTIVTLVPLETTSFWQTPIGITLIIVGVLAIVFGLMMSKAEYRSYLLNRFLPIERGPHRLTMEDVLENENRDHIIHMILEQPGIHFNEILRLSGLSAGNLAWHLDILETFKVIRKQRVGQYLIYYPYLEKNPISKLDLKLQKSKTTLEILQLINDHPGIYQNQIAKRMDLDHKTVKYHLDKLVEADVVEYRKDGRSWRYYPKNIPDDEINSAEDMLEAD